MRKRRSERMLAAIIAVTMSSAVLPAQQAPQASGDMRIVVIRQHFINIDLHRRLSEYDKVAYGLTDIIRIAKECIRDGSEPQESQQALQKAEKDLLELQRMLPGKIMDILAQMEHEANGLKDIDDRSIRDMEQWVEAVSRVRSDSLDYTYSILMDIKAFSTLYAALAIAGMTQEQRTSHLRASDDLVTAVDFACAATEPAKAEQYFQEARRHFDRLERIAAQAEKWRELRDKKVEDGGVDLNTLDMRRRDLDMVEAEVSRLMPWANKLSREAPAFQDAYDIAKRIHSRQKEFAGDLLPLINAYRETLKIHDVNNSPLQWWLIAGTVLCTAPESMWKSLDSVVAELKKPEIRDAGLRLSRVDGDIQELRRVIDKIQADILETDAFAGLCITAAKTGDSNLKRADRCLRSAPLRAQMAAQNQQGQASGNTPPTGQTPPAPSQQPPQTPPAPSASPAQPPQQASQNAVPPIEPNVSGGIKIAGGSAEIFVGQSVRFIATDMGNRPYANAIWNSHDEELLSLGGDGIATGLKPGPVTIQARTSEDPTQIAYYSVVVVEPESQAGGTQTGAAPPASGGFGNRGIDVGVNRDADQPGPSQGSASDTAPPMPPDQPETGSPPIEAEPVEDERQDGISLLGENAASPPPDAEPQDLSPGGGFGDRGLELVPNRDLEPQDETERGRGPRQVPTTGGSASGTRGGTTTPFIPSLTFQQQGQPAAWHIFAAGSRMGWAAAYGRYTDGPADQDIINHLIMAGEHSMWANRESYEPYKAWPHWSEIKIRCRTWAEQVIASPRGELREQLALAVSSYAGNLAEQVTFQVLGDRKRMPNCDGAYMRLGFHMAFGQTSLQLAEGARLTGQVPLIEKARKDAVNHLRQAVGILIEYEKTEVVTGRCADLRDVRAEMESLLNNADLATQIRMIMHAWETASERIRALSSVTAQPQSKITQAPTPPADPPRPAVTGIPASPAEPGADLGNIEGEWFLCRRFNTRWYARHDVFLRQCFFERNAYSRFTNSGNNPQVVRFEKSGEQYIGTDISNGSQLFSLSRSDQATYRGTGPVVSGSRQVQMRVEGDFAEQIQLGVAVGVPGEFRSQWVRRAPRYQEQSPLIRQLPPYGPKTIQSIDARGYEIEVAHQFSTLVQQVRDFTYRKPGNPQTVKSQGDVQSWRPSAGFRAVSREGTTFTATWQESGVLSGGILQNHIGVGSSSYAGYPEKKTTTASMVVQLDPSLQRIQGVRLTQHVVAPLLQNGRDPAQWTEDIEFEAVDIPYVWQSSTPDLLVFEFPGYGSTESSCSRIRNLKAQGVESSKEGKGVVDLAGAPCDKNPGRISVTIKLLR